MTSRTSRSRRPLLVAFLTILLTGVAASAAHAADPPPEPITTGTIDWGVKESFRTYVEAGFARGSIATLAPATRTAAGTFAFPIRGGEFDPGIYGTVVGSAGEVRFSGHRGELDMRISDVRVELLPEGALLRADVQSVPQGMTRSIAYPDVVLAELDLSAVEPETADGVTTWSAIPATLAREGAPAFSGYYTAGAELDPVTLSYTGNGGKPQPEDFTAPGTPLYSRLDTDTPGRGRVFHDPLRRLVHKVGQDAVNAVDERTMQTVGTPLAHGLTDDDQIEMAVFDAAAGRIVAAHRDGRASLYTWNGNGYTQETLPGMHGTPLLAVAGGKIYFAPNDGDANPVLTVISGGPGAWTVRADYPAIDTGGVAIKGIAGLPDGRLVATVRWRAAGGPVPQAALLLTDIGGAFVATPIEGTALPRGSGLGMTLGYEAIRPGSDGSLLLSETILSGPMRVQKLRFDGAGATVDGPPLVIERTSDWTVNPHNGRIVLSYETSNEAGARIDVRNPDGSLFADVRGLPAMFVAAAPDDTLYALDNGTERTAKLHVSSVSPTVTGDPQDAAVELADAGATATATFTAAADATPAATVQWQRRPLGVTRWSDVAGATTPTLTVTAGAAENGDRYRAVFENGGGRIGTRPATLKVTVAAPRPPVDQPRAPAEQPRAPAARSPRRGAIVAPSGTRRAGRGGIVRVATIRCPRGAACRVTDPRQGKVRIGGRTFRARVLAPATVAAGGSATVRVKLPRAALRRLAAGRAALVAVKVTLRAGTATPLTRTAKVRVRAAAPAARR